jgi:putative transposase
VVTPEGLLRQCFVLAFVHVASRRAWLSPCSFKPDAGWVHAHAGAFLAHADRVGMPAGVVVRDRDCKFSMGFDAALVAGGARPLQTPYRSPNVNAYVERFVQVIGQECLDKLMVFGPEHLDHVMAEYLAYYNEERPDQAKGNEPLAARPASTNADGEVVCRDRLGGLLRHYYRLAA